MALKRLAEDVQSMIDSSSRINCYKRAIEELVYNSLDAKSTSIAIRINLDEKCIQVVDNGHGLSSHDMVIIGKKHMTSKCQDLTTLKSVPEFYGYRGMALACIIEVSEELKVISRHESTEQSWVTEFSRGKLVGTSEIQTRPSKGTTIQIKGFLYNLNIQSKSINPLQQLQEIKCFLEQLSLMHSNLSLSLRDNVNNEIIFKMHKCKDIYQKIKMLFDIEEKAVKELKVMKDKYKAEGYISEDHTDIHWIYLNGRCLENSKINIIVDNALNKFNCNGKGKFLAKSRGVSDRQEKVAKRNIPFYIIFLTCPYDDYYLNQLPKKSLLEFQNWNEITKLIERLIKFYYGDDKINEIKKSNIINKVNEPNDIRNKVKEIMQKVLGKNNKISQMKNGVKGKVTKRKKKKNKIDFSLNKFIPKPKPTDASNSLDSLEKSTHSEHNIICNINAEMNQSVLDKSCNNVENISRKTPNDLVDCTVQQSITKDSIGIIPKNKKLRCTKTTTKYDVSMVVKNPCLESNKNINNEMFVHNIYSLLNNLHKANEEAMNKEHNLNKNKQNITIKRNVRNVVITKSVSFPQALESIYKLEKVINKCLNSEVVPVKRFHSRNDLINTILSTQTGTKSTKHNILAIRNYNKEVYDNFVESPHFVNIANIHSPEAIEYNHDADIRNESNNIEKPYKQNKDISINSFISVDNNNYVNNFVPIDNTEKLLRRQNNRREKVDTIEKYLSTFESHKRNEKNYRRSTFQNRRYISKKSQNEFNIRDNFQVRHLRNRSIYIKPKDNKIIGTVNNRGTAYAKYKTNVYTKLLKDNILYDKDQQQNRINTVPHKNKLVNKIEFSKKFGQPKQNLVQQAILEGYNNFQDTDYNFHSDINISKSITMRKQDDANISDNTICHSKEKNIGNIAEDLNMVNITNFKIVSETKTNSTYNKSNNMDNTTKDNNKSMDVVSVSSKRHDISEYSESDIFKDDIIDDSKNDTVIEPIDNLMSDEHTKQSITGTINNNKIEHAIDDKTVTDNLEAVRYVPINLEGNGNKELENHKIENYLFANKVTDNKTFKLKERLNFVPKGMSPIFNNPTSKQNTNVFNSSNAADYFNDSLYKDFEKHVQIGKEIFEANIQNINDLATKEIVNFNHKIKKYNADIVFDADSLKSVKVLRQVDNKFIAARISTNNNKTNKSIEYLVLFDQHAVHERIRLEDNLKDYMYENSWKPKSLDSFTATLSPEQALYLHNYKEKFMQFGLNWTFVDDKDISVTAIPEAIIGKHVRNVEVILTAVKSLIQEQIRAIKDQKGSVSLYPKSIMDLVFSEACRYAIKFGDHLSTAECVELLTSLQKCKTPFQCAHGRPVLAVLCEIKNTVHTYDINVEKLKTFYKTKNVLFVSTKGK